jgi:aminoglycoside phosphotransferase (APT) family kinase protein
VSRWIEGIRLNELRRQAPPEVVTALARPLGALAAQVAQTAAPKSLARARTAALEEAAGQLRVGRARDRLGATTADRLRGLLEEHARELAPHQEQLELVHGDFGGRNLLVTGAADAWRITGLIDWEMAFRGWGLWDVGSLFRYRRRFGASFRDGFAHGYAQTGGALPADWFRLARLLDATRSVATLAEELEHLQDVFADCREVLEGVVQDWL